MADTMNAMMAIPNLIAPIVLSPVVFAITKEFFDARGKSENNPFYAFGPDAGKNPWRRRSLCRLRLPATPWR